LTVGGCTVRDTGAEYHAAGGIVAGYVSHTAIVHNDISRTSSGAVCIGWGWGAANTMHANNISRNHISRSNSDVKDTGSIYTLSEQPGSEVSYNYIEDQQLLYGSLYHDARSAGFHTHHNVVTGGPMWLYLQYATLGPVYDILVERNYFDQPVAGGCATSEYADTCEAHGFCPQHYDPRSCGNVTLRDNLYVRGGAWPSEARAIKAAAGAHTY